MPYVLQELCQIAKAWIYWFKQRLLAEFAPMRILSMVRAHWFGEKINGFYDFAADKR